MKTTLILVSTILMIPMAVVTSAHAKTSHPSTMHPRISYAKARTIASAKVPHGHIASHELEREGGRLIYSFDFRVPGKTGIDEVNVDASNDKVLAVRHEDPKAEHKEALKERQETKSTR